MRSNDESISMMPEHSTSVEPVAPDDVDDALRLHMPQPMRGFTTPFRYFGGKLKYAGWILRHLPRNNIYCEPFCGAAGVFWNINPPMRVEVLNDIDHKIITLFRALQDPNVFKALVHRLLWTPFSREEYRKAISILKAERPTDIPMLDRAWATFVAINQMHTPRSGNLCDGSWGYTFSWQKRSGLPSQVHNWQIRLSSLHWWHWRLMRVQIESMDAVRCIKRYDTAETTFYLDPPYPSQTRSRNKVYKHEMGDDLHQRLVATLLDIHGAAVLSGYESPIYEPLINAGWQCIKKTIVTPSIHTNRHTGSAPRATRKELGDNALRTECIYINPRALALLEGQAQHEQEDQDEQVETELEVDSEGDQETWGSP